jgi:putative membrane-bound dehydrogenase-like protein
MRGIKKLFGVAAVALISFAFNVASAQQLELIPHAQDRPPGPALSPAQAIAKMVVPKGFHVELVASEPDIVNPVAMTFDEKGRIWITESLEYPRQSPGKGRDRVKVLEDTNGDGRADKFTVFADGLNIPSGIAVGHGGVWIANAPDILFYPNMDRDLVPDGPPQVVATGFGRDDTHELPNSLTWGPDGWLYGWNGVFNQSHVKAGNKQWNFTCAIFRIHPRTREFQVWCEGTSNPWGIAINDNGDFFASACVIDHLWHLAESGYYHRQGGPYPPYTWKLGSIVDHAHQKAAYCGIHYFDSPAYPPEYRNRLYMGNIHGNCINSDRLEAAGATYRAREAPDFLTANDAWFMPVVQKTGPDGCLYILDWYDRYHCYQDANRDPNGIDRLKGRLYRVRFENTPRRSGFDLAHESDADLLKALASENVYDRDIAQRLLAERPSPAISADLERLILDNSSSRKARMHAVWALASRGPLRPEFHAKLFAHQDSSFRAWAARAAGEMKQLEPSIVRALELAAADSSPDVQLQVAIAARKVSGIDAVALLSKVLFGCGHDPTIPHIVWETLLPLWEAHSANIVALLKQPAIWDRPNLAGMSSLLVERTLASDGGATVIVDLVRSLSAEPASQTRDIAINRILNALAQRVETGEIAGARLDKLKQTFRPIAVSLRDQSGRASVAANAQLLASSWGDAEGSAFANQQFASLKGSDADRLRALLALVSSARHDRTVSPPREIVTTALRIAADPSAGSADFRGRVISALGGLNAPIAQLVLDAYSQLEPALRPRAIELLTERPEWSKPLLKSIAEKRIPSAAVNVNQIRRLQHSSDPALRGEVKTIWGTIRDGRNAQRELLVDQMRRFLRTSSGDPTAGQGVFKKLCAQCHKIYGDGQDVGPDITNNGRNDFDQLISNVFDPSLVIGSAYQATTVATKDGRVLSGLLAESSPERVVLKIQGGKTETIPRPDVEELKSSDVSLMPEDVEKQLAPQEIADLFAFLALDKPPTDPAAKRLPGAPVPVAPKAPSGP